MYYQKVKSKHSKSLQKLFYTNFPTKLKVHRIRVIIESFISTSLCFFSQCTTIFLIHKPTQLMFEKLQTKKERQRSIILGWIFLQMYLCVKPSLTWTLEKFSSIFLWNAYIFTHSQFRLTGFFCSQKWEDGNDAPFYAYVWMLWGMRRWLCLGGWLNDLSETQKNIFFPFP